MYYSSWKIASFQALRTSIRLRLYESPIFLNRILFDPNWPCVLTKPVNPVTEPALFWNRSPERFKAPFTWIQVKFCGWKCLDSWGHGQKHSFVPLFNVTLTSLAIFSMITICTSANVVVVSIDASSTVLTRWCGTFIRTVRGFGNGWENKKNGAIIYWLIKVHR